MEKIWFERERLQAYDELFAGLAEPLGPGTPEDPFRGVDEATAIVAGILPYDAALLARAPKLRVIARAGIGVDNVDTAAASARGVAVLNTPDAPSVPTAEQTVMLVLAVAKRLKESENRLRAGAENFHPRHHGLELAGKTLGLAGFGRIARLVAKRLGGFDMHLLSYDPYVDETVMSAAGVRRAESFAELLAAADVLSLHLPLTPDTRHIMNEESFAQMKRGSVFVNASRGGLVDEAALLAALQSGQLMGAGLDVTDPEPAAPNNPLLNMENVLVTPHVASATPEGKTRMFVGALKGVVQVLKGERPEHLVNPGKSG